MCISLQCAWTSKYVKFNWLWQTFPMEHDFLQPSMNMLCVTWLHLKQQPNCLYGSVAVSRIELQNFLLLLVKLSVTSTMINDLRVLLTPAAIFWQFATMYTQNSLSIAGCFNFLSRWAVIASVKLLRPLPLIYWWQFTTQMALQ